MSADPIGQAGGVNLFKYARTNPTSWMDPLGLNPNGEGEEGSFDSIVDAVGDAASKVKDAVDSAVDAAKDAALDAAVDLFASGKNKQTICGEKRRACITECTDTATMKEDIAKCDAEFADCMTKTGSDILNEVSDEIPDPPGVTAPDSAKSKTPNAVDRFSRGRGKKID